MLSIQVNAEGLFMDGVRMPLESNQMLLYADPARAPRYCPLEENPSSPGARMKQLGLFGDAAEQEP
jgi:hypothetical protein